MGFMDLSVIGSDQAADSASACVQAFAKQLRHELDKPANEYNTPGPLNVAMIIGEMCDSTSFIVNDEMQELARECLVWLKDNPRYGDDNTRSIKQRSVKFIKNGSI